MSSLWSPSMGDGPCHSSNPRDASATSKIPSSLLEGLSGCCHTKAGEFLKDSDKDDLAQQTSWLGQSGASQCQAKDHVPPASKWWAHQALPVQGVAPAKSPSGLALAVLLKPLTLWLHTSSKICCLYTHDSRQPEVRCLLGSATCIASRSLSVSCHVALSTVISSHLQKKSRATGGTGSVWVPAAHGKGMHRAVVCPLWAIVLPSCN